MKDNPSKWRGKYYLVKTGSISMIENKKEGKKQQNRKEENSFKLSEVSITSDLLFQIILHFLLIK
jgi:hypothetical protein